MRIDVVKLSAAPAIVLAMMAAVLVTAGCKKGNSADTTARVMSRMKPLAVLYGQASAAGGRIGPPNEERFKKFVEQRMQTMFRKIEYDNIDDLFTSERDGQPYVFFYGKKPPGVHPEVAGYEQTGVNGKRFVGFVLGEVEEVDEERFRELVPTAP